MFGKRFVLYSIFIISLLLPSFAFATDVRGPWEVSVTVDNSSATYKGTWFVGIEGTNVFGASKWDCCPGYRMDRLSGSVNGAKVEIIRHVVGQGNASGTQTYSGAISGDTVSGTWSGIGGSGRFNAIIKK